MTQQAVSLVGGYATGDGWAYRGSLGSILHGELETSGMATSTINPGVLGSLGVTHRWQFGADQKMFVSASGDLSASRSTTSIAGGPKVTLIGTDVRVGAVAGATLADVYSPYVLARAFGGPVLWEIANEDATGSDTSHFQLGAGIAVAIPGGLNLVLDVAALGERAASLGLSYQL